MSLHRRGDQRLSAGQEGAILNAWQDGERAEDKYKVLDQAAIILQNKLGRVTASPSQAGVLALHAACA